MSSKRWPTRAAFPRLQALDEQIFDGRRRVAHAAAEVFAALVRAATLEPLAVEHVFARPHAQRVADDIHRRENGQRRFFLPVSRVDQNELHRALHVEEPPRQAYETVLAVKPAGPDDFLVEIHPSRRLAVLEVPRVVAALAAEVRPPLGRVGPLPAQRDVAVGGGALQAMLVPDARRVQDRHKNALAVEADLHGADVAVFVAPASVSFAS